MCNELDRIAFCIWRIIDSHLSPTSSLMFFSPSFEQPPRTSMMMLYWLTLYSGYRFVSSKSQLTVLRCLLGIFRLSIFQPWTAHFNHSDLLAALVNDRGVDSISFYLSCVYLLFCLPFSFSYSGLGVTCENHGSTLVMRSKDLRTSKNKILKALLCLCRYLVCVSAW